MRFTWPWHLIWSLAAFLTLQSAVTGQILIDFPSDVETVKESDVKIHDLAVNSLSDPVMTLEFIQFKDLKNRDTLDRWCLARSGDLSSAIFFFRGVTPNLFFTNQDGYVPQNGELLSQADSKWTFAVDGVHLGIGVESDWARSQDQNQIVLKLRDSIRLLIANELNKPLRLPRLQTYQLISQRGNPLEVRERTPNDSLRLKCPLASYTVAGTNSCYYVYNVTLGSELDATKLFRVPDGTVTREVDDLRPFAGQTSVPDAIKLGDRMWRPDPDEGFKQAMPQKYRDYFYSESWPAISGVSVRETIELMRSLSRGSGGDASADAIPLDDMLLRWARLDRQLGVRLSSIRGIVYPQLMLASDSDVSLDEKFALTDALADLGESLIPYYVDPTKSTHWQACEAVLLARYRRPWTEGHLAACQQLLPTMKEFSAGEFAIVKTLILMDEIESAPAPRVTRWYQRHVTHGTRFEQRDGLRQLTLTPTGREWLRKRLSEDRTDPPEIRTLACSFLRQRAEATMQTQQWDFMSKVECEETMAFLKALPSVEPPSPRIRK